MIVRLALFICIGLLSSWIAETTASADLIIYDGFNYTAGFDIKSQNGGSGWETAWNGDAEMKVSDIGLSFTDAIGNQLEVAGNAARGSGDSGKKVERELSASSDVLWTSVLINGVTGSDVANFSLEQKLMVGQGNTDIAGSTWAMFDQDGLVRDSGVSVGTDTTLLVFLIEFSAGDETAWFWINPLLDTAPSKSSSVSGVAGDTVKDFGVTKVQVWSGNENAVIDGIRIGTTFEGVTPYVAVPESSGNLIF